MPFFLTELDLTPAQVFAKNTPDPEELGGRSADNAAQSLERRITREVVAIRFSKGERWQVAKAAGRRKVFSAYVREASVRAAVLASGHTM